MVDIKAYNVCSVSGVKIKAGGVMFWAAIIHDKLVGIFQVRDSVKISAPTYIECS